jgi:hypothetical protein
LSLANESKLKQKYKKLVFVSRIGIPNVGIIIYFNRDRADNDPQQQLELQVPPEYPYLKARAFAPPLRP